MALNPCTKLAELAECNNLAKQVEEEDKYQGKEGSEYQTQ